MKYVGGKQYVIGGIPSSAMSTLDNKTRRMSKTDHSLHRNFLQSIVDPVQTANVNFSRKNGKNGHCLDRNCRQSSFIHRAASLSQMWTRLTDTSMFVDKSETFHFLLQYILPLHTTFNFCIFLSLLINLFSNSRSLLLSFRNFFQCHYSSITLEIFIQKG